MKENSSKPLTGTGSLIGDLLVLSILIVAGVYGTVWFFTLEQAESTRVLHGGVALIWPILIQPGVFLSWFFFKNAIRSAEQSKPWKQLAVIGLTVGIIIGLILPLALAKWINGLI